MGWRMLAYLMAHASDLIKRASVWKVCVLRKGLESRPSLVPFHSTTH